MQKKSKLLITMAGIGLLGLMTGCAQEEVVVTPPTSLQANESGSIPQLPDSSGNNIIGDIKPKTETNKIRENATSEESVSPSGVVSVKPAHAPGSTNELVALTDTEESAKEIAALYDIELKSFASGVAVYTTDKDPYEVIQLGIDNGYPTLSLNHRLELH